MSTTLDRRNFLQQGAVSGACASLAVSAGRAAAQTDTNSKVVLGVMGLSRGRSLAVNFARRPGVEIKYVCDVDSNRAGAAAELVHGAVQKKPPGGFPDGFCRWCGRGDLNPHAFKGTRS